MSRYFATTRSDTPSRGPDSGESGYEPIFTLTGCNSLARSAIIILHMPPSWIRTTVCIYLTALALTSMPITVGLFGWCPCGCLPETLVPYDHDPAEPASNGEHHHDSQHCRGCQVLSYCPLVGELPLTEWLDAGPLAADCQEQIPPTHAVRLIRPPRA